jgi:hypothetical protein
VVLGNHPRIESVGEVGNLMRNGWISRESLRGIDPKRLRRPICSCGKRLDVLYVEAPEEACPFWSRVRGEWVGRAGRETIESYPKLQRRFRAYETRASRTAIPSLALREAQAVSPIPVVCQIDVRVLRIHTCGEWETRHRRLY